MRQFDHPSLFPFPTSFPPGQLAAGLCGIYLSLTLGIAMFILAGISFIGFMIVRVWRWWMHG